MSALIASVVSGLVPKLAARGMDLLSSVFKTVSKTGKGTIEGAARKTLEDITLKLSEKTGISLEDIADDKLTEEQWRQLKEFELQEQELLLGHQQEMSALELELEKTLVADAANARQAGVQRDQNDDKFVRRFTYYFAFLITSLTFLFIILAILLPTVAGDRFPREAWQIINTVVGFLLGVGLSAIIQYFFGSSMGSKQKSDLLRSLGGPKA